MPTLIEKPSRVEAAGTKPKLIDEYVGRANTGEGRLPFQPSAPSRRRLRRKGVM